MANPAWVKGVSGNPKGRPRKGKTLTDILEKELRKKNVRTPEGDIPAKEALARKIIALAIDGDVAALKYIFDRVDGKPLASVDVHDDSGTFLDALEEAHRIREREAAQKRAPEPGQPEAGKSADA